MAEKKLHNEDPSILNVKKICTVVQIPGRVPAPQFPVVPDGCHPSCRGWRSSCPDNLFSCYFLYPMSTFLLRLFYSHVVPCRGSLSECLRCWCWMYPTTHDGLHPAEGNSTLKNWQWALTDLTVEADPPQLVFTQIWRNQSPREYTYLIFVIFLHGQNFWRIKFAPKNANFSR